MKHFTHKRTTVVIFVIVVMAGLLSACALPPAPPPRGQQVAVTLSPLAGSKWTLVALNGQPPIAGAMITLNFEPVGKASGSDGCNNYTMTYMAEGSSITFGPMAGTLMACAEPIMQQATAYQQALMQAASYTMEGDRLALMDFSGQTLALFAPQSAELAGTSWKVMSYNNGKQAVVSIIIGTALTANFGTDGVISGNAGCNNYSGGYAAEGEKITIGFLAATQKLCDQPEGVMEQEAQYLTALQTAATYRMDGNAMEVRTADGALAASFQRAAAMQMASGATDAITPDQIHLDTQGLPYTWKAVTAPATPYDASQPPGPTGLPEHIQVVFDVDSSADNGLGSPIMYIIPVEDYRQLWDAAGNAAVSKTLQVIYDLSVAMPQPPPTSSVPALPFEAVGAGVNDLAVQFAGVNTTFQSASKTGYRFVGRWMQDFNPVTNQGLRYVYQGFTNDGQYLVSFFHPITTTALPNTMQDLPEAVSQQAAANPAAYLQQEVARLNALDSTDWTPPLETLDALVASLQIDGMQRADFSGTWSGNQSNLKMQRGVPAGLSIQALANTTYSSELVAGGTVTLTHGSYSTPAAPGSASTLEAHLTKNIAYGALNGAASAAVVLVGSGNGSGAFYTLHIMQSGSEAPDEAAYTSLGDRVKINSISIEDNRVAVDMVTHGPGDPLCCPTQRIVRTYTLQGDQLVEE